jgi:hypothetical protein
MPRIATQQKQPQDQKKAYLRAFSMTGTLTAGCRAARVSPNTVYAWREHDDEFVLLENQAKNAFADALEQEAVRRAWHGTQKPVYQNGLLVGYIREFSDTLLIFALKAIRPDKYRERFDVTTQGRPIYKAYAADDIAMLDVEVKQ